MLAVEHISKDFPGGRTGWGRASDSFRALDDVSLTIRKGESFGLVGESGSGKTTLTRCILQIERPSAGRIVFDGVDLGAASASVLQRLRARIQIVFQDPYASLNPRMNVRDIVAEPLDIHADAFPLTTRQKTDRVAELLGLVGLEEQHLHRFPHEFSGGQRQRIGIARALASNPDFLVLDEPTSALDVSVQAQILNLLHRLQSQFGLTYLFVSHDLAVVRYVCDRVALLHRGRIVEEGTTDAVFDAPSTEYGRMLLSAVPDTDPDKSPLRKPAA